VYLLLALGVRKMELLAARWNEFDIDAGIWHLPASRTKTGMPQDIPLAAAVQEWLEELKVRACDSDYVFPARRSSKRPHVSPDTVNFALAKLPHGLPPFTIHDFRRTARTLLASLGVSSEVAERCMNHKLRGVEGTYNVHDYFDERKAALFQLASLVVAVQKADESNVVPILSGKVA
jgi:integrase